MHYTIFFSYIPLVSYESSYIRFVRGAQLTLRKVDTYKSQYIVWHMQNRFSRIVRKFLLRVISFNFTVYTADVCVCAGLNCAPIIHGGNYRVTYVKSERVDPRYTHSHTGENYNRMLLLLYILNSNRRRLDERESDFSILPTDRTWTRGIREPVAAIAETEKHERRYNWKIFLFQRGNFQFSVPLKKIQVYLKWKKNLKFECFPGI